MASQEQVNQEFLSAIKDSDLRKLKWLFSPFRLGKKPDVDAVDENGLTALMCAVTRHDYNIMMYVIEKGADLDKVNQNGETAVYYATKTMSSGNLQRLWENGADINIPDRNGKTPLMCALCEGDSDDAIYLMLRKADIFRTDNNGHTAMTYAAMNGRYTALRELLRRWDKKKRKTTLMAEEIHKAYYYAKLNGHQDEMDLLMPYVAKLPKRDPRTEAKQKKLTLQEQVKTLSGDELIEKAQKDKTFIDGVIAAGLLLQMVERLTYHQARPLYNNIRDKIPPAERTLVENAIRLARQKVAM